MATIITKDSSCQMATARPGVMKQLEPDDLRAGNVVRVDVQIGPEDLSLDVLSTERGTGEVNFGAEVIVSGGKGMHDRDNFNAMAGGLCKCIHEVCQVTTEAGASRAAIEYGLADRVRQVGQTGSTVAPKLYIAIGISGAIQHMIGVANAGVIVAINSDPNAAIFRQCDYYMVGAAENVIPELVEKMKTLDEKAAGK